MHEIKYDGYRMIARLKGDRVRLYTRRGFNWADRYPHIVDALRSIELDGEDLRPAALEHGLRLLHSGIDFSPK